MITGTMITSYRVGLAAAVCGALVAALLTAYAGWLLAALVTFVPPAGTEGPSVFAALVVAGSVAAWLTAEAVAAWLTLAHVVRRFPEGRRTGIAVFGGLAVVHALVLLVLGTGFGALFTAAAGAVVPLAATAAALFARAQRRSVR
ncbi:hypothetical protein BJF78_20395 [Pseudonocardia sp. CNS-139]|nr:hypothetical protein BJF78_20395 [Pseudonocardia sp. CNS-139]